MFFHIGKDVTVRKRDVIAILDIDTNSPTACTKDFLKKSEKNGKVILAGEDLPKSVVVCDDGEGGAWTVYSHISSKGLSGRASSGYRDNALFIYEKDR